MKNLHFNKLLKKKQTVVRIDGVDYAVKFAPTPGKACFKCSLRNGVHCNHIWNCQPFDRIFKKFSYFDEIEKKEDVK